MFKCSILKILKKNMQVIYINLLKILQYLKIKKINKIKVYNNLFRFNFL